MVLRPALILGSQRTNTTAAPDLARVDTRTLSRPLERWRVALLCARSQHQVLKSYNKWFMKEGGQTSEEGGV